MFRVVNSSQVKKQPVPGFLEVVEVPTGDQSMARGNVGLQCSRSKEGRHWCSLSRSPDMGLEFRRQALLPRKEEQKETGRA